MCSQIGREQRRSLFCVFEQILSVGSKNAQVKWYSGKLGHNCTWTGAPSRDKVEKASIHLTFEFDEAEPMPSSVVRELQHFMQGL